jgi:hypothetical protein
MGGGEWSEFHVEYENPYGDSTTRKISKRRIQKSLRDSNLKDIAEGIKSSKFGLAAAWKPIQYWTE